MIFTSIEIARSPEEVRKVFLDFEAYPKWHKGFIKSIKPLSTDRDPLAVGKKLICTLDDTDFEVEITQNTPTTFQWQGPPVMGIAGLHTFVFEPSRLREGGTRFIQMEEYEGWLAFLVQSWLAGWGLHVKYTAFNGELKEWVESL